MLQALHQQLRRMAYRHGPVRQITIEMEDGVLRPLGINCTAGKICAGATRHDS